MGIAKIRGNRGEGWFHGRSFWGRLGNLPLTGSKILFDTFAKSDYYSVRQARNTWQGVWEDSAGVWYSLAGVVVILGSLRSTLKGTIRSRVVLTTLGDYVLTQHTASFMECQFFELLLSSEKCC